MSVTMVVCGFFSLDQTGYCGVAVVVAVAMVVMLCYGMVVQRWLCRDCCERLIGIVAVKARQSSPQQPNHSGWRQ